MISTTQHRDLSRFCTLPGVSLGGHSQLIGATKTGIPELDLILGPGIPRGHIVEIYGNEASGKTALALQMASQFPGPVLYIDADYTLDALPLQVAKTDIYRLRPETFETALDACMVAAPAVDAIVWDSLPALPLDREEKSRSPDDLDYTPIFERVLEAGLKRLIPELRRSGCTLVIVTQMRRVPSIVFGPKEQPLDGRALRGFASLRLQTVRTSCMHEGPDITGVEQTVIVTKNKYYTPSSRATYNLRFGVGFESIPQKSRHR